MALVLLGLVAAGVIPMRSPRAATATEPSASDQQLIVQADWLYDRAKVLIKFNLTTEQDRDLYFAMAGLQQWQTAEHRFQMRSHDADLAGFDQFVWQAIVSDKNDCKNILARYHLRLAGEYLKAAKDPDYDRPMAGPDDEPADNERCRQ